MIIGYIIVIVLGLMLGSFLSCFSYRLPRKIDFIKGRSFCPKCKSKIFWFDNIPLLSFLLLKGKCRNCKKKISFKYPLLEVVTALSFLSIFIKFYPNILDVAVYILFYLITVSIIIIDLEKGIIPDELTFLGFVISFFYIIFFRNNNSYLHILGGFSLSTLMLLIHLVTKGKGMGLGDVKFALFPGIILLFPYNIFWFFLSFLIGSVIGVILILLKKAKFGKPIPFGPFLGISFIIIIIWGEFLFKWIILKF